MKQKLTYKQKCELFEFLCQFVTENRRKRLEEVAGKRTRFITVVLEDIYQSQNASAVLRTCDCFGIQDVHIIENKNIYNVNPDVALGSSNWLSLYHYNKKENNTSDCIKKLKKQGYSIIAATPHKNDCLLEELDINSKTAIMFGTEKEGLSEIALKNADGFIKIPMFGFTESFNISVSAAITLFSITEKSMKSSIQWQLSKEEIIDILVQWTRNSISKGEMLEKKFLSSMV
jgi:tRNA (guanosine-2'-O-)-methyltransferase